MKLETKLLICIGLGIAGSLALHLFQGSAASSGFGTASLVRITILLFAVWLALPSLRRPAQWLPPGITAVLLVGVGAIVVQPRLAIVLVPIIGVLIGFAGVLRFFRGG